MEHSSFSADIADRFVLKSITAAGIARLDLSKQQLRSSAQTLHLKHFTFDPQSSSGDHKEKSSCRAQAMPTMQRILPGEHH